MHFAFAKKIKVQVGPIAQRLTPMHREPDLMWPTEFQILALAACKHKHTHTQDKTSITGILLMFFFTKQTYRFIVKKEKVQQVHTYEDL